MLAIARQCLGPWNGTSPPGLARGVTEVTAEELADYRQRRREADPSELARLPGLETVPFAEGGLEFRWHPHFIVGAGVRYYSERGYVPVVRLGLGGDGFLRASN